MRLPAILLAGLFSASVLPAAVDPGLLALVPADTQIISGVHVDQSRVSPFGQFVISQMQLHPGHLQKLVDTTGFDPRKDVNEVLMASSGPRPNLGGLVLARGSFNPTQVENAATAKGAVIQTYLGVDMIIGKNEAASNGAGEHGGDGGVVAFLDNTLAVAGSQAAVENAIANRANKTPLIPQELLAKVNQLSATNDAWFVSLVAGSTLVPSAAKSGTGNSGTGVEAPVAAMQAIQQSSGGVHFGDQIAISFQAQTRSDKDAESLADVVRMVASMIQMKRQENAQLGVLANAFDGMNLSTNGSTMTLFISVPEQAAEQLAQAAQNHEPHATRP